MLSYSFFRLLIDRIYLFETYKSHKNVLSFYYFTHNYPMKKTILKEYDCQVYLIDNLGQQHYSYVCFFWMDMLFTQGNKPIKEEDERMIRKIVDGMDV